MAGLYVKNANGDWVLTNHQYGKFQSTGWRRALSVHQKTGVSTWTERISYDDAPPAAPTLTNVMDATNRTVTTTIKLPNEPDVVGAVLKISDVAYPTNPESSVGKHVTIQADGQPYSDITAGPNATKTRVAVKAGAGRRYYLRCWTKDANGNYSTTPASWSGVFPYPPAPAPTLVTKTAYVTTTASGSYNRASGYWRTDNNYVYQGAPYHWEGRWFYGGKLSALLAKAVEIKHVKIYIQRHNSQHGVSSRAHIHFGWHGQTSKPSGLPIELRDRHHIVSLFRNEGQWLTLAPTWYGRMKTGEMAGFGTYAGITTVVAPEYAYCYGAGTDSGKLEVQWTEYA